MKRNRFVHLLSLTLFFEWPKRLAFLFAALLLYQYVIWFAEYWLPETEIVMKYTLIIVFLTEIIPKLHWTLRRLLQLIALVTMHFSALEYSLIDGTLDSFSAFSQWVVDNFLIITPFVWFSLVFWLVYLVIMWWVKEKLRIFLLIIFSVVTFAIMDSFSLYVFWDQVALIIFSGLGLLIVRHFEQFRVKNPTSWQYFAEYPGMITLPIIVLITIVMAAGLLAPNIKPILTDPYTAWKTMKGEAVFTGGKGVLNVTGGLGDSSSGYSRDDLQLGGGFNFDYKPIMTVDTTHSSYWRGETKSLYTGKGWEQSSSEKQPGEFLVTSNEELTKIAVFDTSNRKTKEVRQTITVLREEPYPVLFGAYSVQSVGEVNGSEKGTPIEAEWVPLQEELRWNKAAEGEYPAIYTVVSQMPIIDEAGLRTALEKPVNPGDLRDYLQLPAALPDRVKQLAAEITNEESNVYDKVKKIEAYLREAYPYTNKPNIEKAKSDDFVDSFLFEIKEGYCDYYSTAMAILVRSIGVPARWVKGYAPGQQPLEEFRFNIPGDMVDPEGPGRYTVRNADAHSWVEVYFQGWGWIPFEPTAGFVLPSIEALNETAVEDSIVGNSEGAEKKTGYGWLIGASVGLALLMILLAFAWVINKKYGLLSLLKGLQRFRPEITHKRKVVSEFEKFLRYSRHKGFQRREHETARETMRRWSQQNKWLEKDLGLLLAIFEKAKYSKYNVTDEDVENTSKIVRRLREEM